MSNEQSQIEAADPKEQPVEQATETSMIPEPSAMGSASVTVLKHNLCEAGKDRYDAAVGIAGVELAIRNVTDLTIATVVFEAIFYDKNGSILHTVRHKELDLRPNTSRAIVINSLYPDYEVKSYEVRLIRTTSADVEKVQFRRCDTRKTETGEQEMTGIVINISPVKLDAVVFATFLNENKENIGTKALLLEGIEPDTIRKYNFSFKPQEGDTVVGCSMIIGEIVR